MRFPKIKPPHLEKIVLTINGQSIKTEVARSDEEQERGLMGRLNLGPRQGMLFVAPSGHRPSLWMKDTPSALSAAWITAKGKILQIIDMEPHSEEIHESPLHTRYALEMRKGAFADLGIIKGSIVEFPLDFRGAE
jgi:uncharacterized protein